MALFWKAAAIILITVILSAAIGKTEKDIALVLTVTACCVISILAVESLSDIVSFLWRICDLSGIQMPFMDMLLRITGVALVSELIGLIGIDSGNSSLGKTMDLLGTAVIMSMSVPLLESFFEIVQEILNII